LGHRVGQFIGHLTARVDPGEIERARPLLPGTAWALFSGMPTADRRHALDVAARLAAAGQRDPDLLAAALLHDSGKGYRMRLWHRVAAVLLDAVSRSALARLASPNQESWRYPFHLYLHHASLSADASLAAGCSPRAAAFIRGSSEPADAPLAAALHRADEGR
jgi:predicted HD phosphohydrolase